ncbi:MAG: pyridoxamine 5'-phosphate oxidase family protein [Candidatus Heimdallarchaeota archaeon]
MSYTQSPPLTDKEIENFLKEAKVARIWTSNKNGTIHAVPVWFGYENGLFVIASPEKAVKIRNILRNTGVTLLVDIESPPRGVIVYGKAEVDFSEWDSEAVKITEKYAEDASQARQWWTGINKLAKWVKITVTPDRMASFDSAKDEKFSEAVS